MATLDNNLMFETHLRQVVSEAAWSLGSRSEQEIYFIVHVCSRTVSMHTFRPARSIGPKCGCCQRSPIWVCWIVLFSTVRLCEGKLSDSGHRRKVNALCLPNKTYYRVDHPMNEHLIPFATLY